MELTNLSATNDVVHRAAAGQCAELTTMELSCVAAEEGWMDRGGCDER